MKVIIRKHFNLTILFFIFTFFYLPATAQAYTVFLEPGHGGVDPGAIGANGLQEKTVNLGISLKIQSLLQQDGYAVVMSRTDNATYSDEDADIIWANNIKSDAFVSIHNNGSDYPYAGGTETWYFPKGPGDILLAQLIHKRMIEAIRGFPYATVDAGLKIPDPGWMISRGTVPAVLVEGLFITNDTESALLQNDSFQWALARGIYQGIRDFLGPYSVIYQQLDTPTAMFPGIEYPTTINVTNHGKFAWSSASSPPIKLSYHWINQSTGQIVEFDGRRVDLPSTILPNTSAFVTAKIDPPDTPGVYRLQFDLVQEGVTWFSWQGAITSDAVVAVRQPGEDAAALTDISIPSSSYCSNVADFQIAVANLGSASLSSDDAQPVHLSYHWINSDTGSFAVFDGVRTTLASDIGPGATSLLSGSVKAPSAPGKYLFKPDLVREGVTWFSWQGTPAPGAIVDILADYKAIYGINNAPDEAIIENTFNINVDLTNSSLMTWAYNGDNPVRLSYHWIDAATGQTIVHDGLRSNLPADIAPGNAASVALQVNAPSIPGAYILRVDLVQEGISWFSVQQVAPADISMQILDTPLPDGPGNRKFIYSLYYGILRRSADPVWSEYHPWVSLLDQGRPRGLVTPIITGSLEASRWAVSDAYTEILAREVDTDGSAFWSGAIAGGAPIRGFQAQLYGSAEYSSRFPDNKEFVDSIYQNILGRASVNNDDVYWINLLNSGSSRAGVALAILGSEERYRRFIGQQYQKILKRSADTGGLSGWVAAMRTGMPEESVINTFYSSAEYFNSLP